MRAESGSIQHQPADQLDDGQVGEGIEQEGEGGAHETKRIHARCRGIYVDTEGWLGKAAARKGGWRGQAALERLLCRLCAASRQRKARRSGLGAAGYA